MRRTLNKTENALLNFITSILLQVVTAAIGLVLPKLMIEEYGSDINGLITSITHFLSYISLVEGGIGAVFRASLYKPLAQKDNEGLSRVVLTQKKFYRKIGYYFLVYVFLLAIIYPRIAKSDVDNWFILIILLIVSVGTALEYFISLPYVALITADQHVRVVSIISIITVVFNFIISVVLIKMHLSVVCVKISTCIIMAVKPCFYTRYVKKQYSINKNVLPDNDILSQRWSGMVHHIAYFLHSNVDIMLLTIFVGTSSVSVYSVYYSVISGIQKVLSSFSSGVSAGIGHLLWDSDKNKINKVIDEYEFTYGMAATVLYTITLIMIVPFVRIYTRKITDENYIVPLFAYTLVIAQWIYCFRHMYSTISDSANMFKKTQVGAILESAINLIVSVFLLFFFESVEYKLFGIALGTLLGMFSRYIFEIFFLSKNVVKRPLNKPLKLFVSALMIMIVSVMISKSVLWFSVDSFGSWIEAAIIVSIVTLSLFFGISFLFFKNELYGLTRRIVRVWRKKNGENK